MTQRNWIIGTRGSDLALWQANHVQALLTRVGYSCDIRIIRTEGDRIQHLGFDKMEGKGFFTKELEAALLTGEIDLAVHSCKDLETTMPEGLCIAGVLERADPRDVVLAKSPDWRGKTTLCIGTSSARRKSQLLRLVPQASFKDLRGNVPTRIRKLLDDPELDAIVLASAGISRLKADTGGLHVEALPVHEFIPAAAQGALAVQTRATEEALVNALQGLTHRETKEVVDAERSLLKAFGGGCQKPVGVHIQREFDGFLAQVSHALYANDAGAIFSKPFASLSEESLHDWVAEVLKKKSASSSPAS